MKFTASFPPADALLAFLAGINYRQLALRLVLLAATVAAVVVALSQFAWRNGRKFWLNHGESIIFHFELFIEWLVGAIEWVYNLGASTRPVVNLWAARAADWLFYLLADGLLPWGRFAN